MSNGLCPFAIHRIIPPGSNDPRITPRVAILHVDAGDAESLYDFFKNRSGGIESHFHVRKDGKIEQYRDIYHQADANRDANDFAVSIETQGLGAGEWNEAQLDSIKRLLLWLRDEAGIPLRQIERWNGSGVGYHTLFGAPSHWTPVAKSCPGEDRKRQFHNVLVPWMNGIGKETPMTHVEAADDLLERGHNLLVRAHRHMKATNTKRVVVHAQAAILWTAVLIVRGVRARLPKR